MLDLLSIGPISYLEHVTECSEHFCDGIGLDPFNTYSGQNQMVLFQSRLGSSLGHSSPVHNYIFSIFILNQLSST